MAAGDDPLTLVRLDVAEMKGMLHQALSDHGQRITNLESDNISLHSRLSEKGKDLARQDERIKDLEESTSGRLGRVTGVIGTVLAILAGSLAVANYLSLNP